LPSLPAREDQVVGVGFVSLVAGVFQAAARNQDHPVIALRVPISIRVSISIAIPVLSENHQAGHADAGQQKRYSFHLDKASVTSSISARKRYVITDFGILKSALVYNAHEPAVCYPRLGWIGTGKRGWLARLG
jgi:hypothetical protein